MKDLGNPQDLGPLQGADDASYYRAYDRFGQIGDPEACIVPILTYRSPGFADYRFIGTGFFIAQGIVATARHVIEAFEPGAYPFVFQFEKGKSVAPRRVHATCIHRNSDVGILRVLVERPGQANRSAVLTALKPTPGSLAYTAVCANTKVWPEAGGQSLAMNVEYFRGSVVEQFPDGRDSVMLPWPCYQVDYHLHAGASGGPTFDKSGAVFAMNCASNSPETDIAYVTSTDMLLGCQITNIDIEGKHYDVATIMDLVNAGIVRYQLD